MPAFRVSVRVGMLFSKTTVLYPKNISFLLLLHLLSLLLHLLLCRAHRGGTPSLLFVKKLNYNCEEVVLRSCASLLRVCFTQETYVVCASCMYCLRKAHQAFADAASSLKRLLAEFVFRCECLGSRLVKETFLLLLHHSFT